MNFNLNGGVLWAELGWAASVDFTTSQVLLFYRYIQNNRPELLDGHGTPALLVGIRGEPLQAEDITRHLKRSYQRLYPGLEINAQRVRQSVIANLLKAGHDLAVVQGFQGINTLRPPSGTGRKRWRPWRRL